MNHQAAAGIDHVSYASYGEKLDRNIADLVKRLRENRYRAYGRPPFLVPNGFSIIFIHEEEI